MFRLLTAIAVVVLMAMVMPQPATVASELAQHEETLNIDQILPELAVLAQGDQLRESELLATPFNQDALTIKDTSARSEVACHGRGFLRRGLKGLGKGLGRLLLRRC